MTDMITGCSQNLWSLYLLSFSPHLSLHQQLIPSSCTTTITEENTDQSCHSPYVVLAAIADMNLFILIVALMPLFSFALVPPAIAKARSNKQDLTIVYHKANADITIEVLSGDNLVGQACSSSLNSGAFESMPILFNVDERGSGNLTIGSFTYRIHEDASHSGGIICSRMFNHAEAAVSCTVTVPADLPMQPLSKSNIAVCIPERHNRLAKLFRVAINSPWGSTTGMGQAEMIFDPPPQPHCGSEEKTQRFGDGDPHQNYYLLQLSVSDS